MGLHPDDPPVSPLQGIARIFTSPDAVRKALSLSDSPSHGLTFCQGTYVTMGAPVAELVREWKDRIFFVHQRDVAGTAENFHETFHDNGPTDMAAMLRVYKEVGFDGPLRSDHVPTMAGVAVAKTAAPAAFAKADDNITAIVDLANFPQFSFVGFFFTS